MRMLLQIRYLSVYALSIRCTRLALCSGAVDYCLAFPLPEAFSASAADTAAA